MIRFPAVDAALEGFRITREHPAAVLIWAAVLLVANVVLQAWMLNAPAMQDLISIYGATPPTTPEAAEAVMAKARVAGPSFALFLLVSGVLNVVLYTAVLRAVLEPARSNGGYLRVGADELRQFALLALIFVLWVLYTVVVNTAAALLTAVAGQAPPVVGGLLKGLIWAAAVVAGLYPVVRLSLAPAMTFAERRISLLRSWVLTRDQFWGLFGAYVLAATLGLLVGLLAMLVFGALAQVAGLASGHAFDLSTVATRKGPMTPALLFSPASVAFMAIFSASYTLAFTILFSAGPSAYGHLAGRSDAPAA